MKKFLIGQLARYGDCLYATVIARQIKHDYPDSHITWAVASPFKSILKYNPYVDKIWEINIENGDYYGEKWNQFEIEALARRKEGEFDEVIFSQVAPNNHRNFVGTIRNSILQSYSGEISVPVEPIIHLSEQEVKDVQRFVERNGIHKYKNVILFECAPNSGQSKLTMELALAISCKIISKSPEKAIIISSSEGIKTKSKQIIDGSGLSFRQQAEITKYCSLLIGCSSGVTWLSTSNWAKKLPMIQILDRNSVYFAGVAYDFQLNNIENSHVVELLSFTEEKIVDCAELCLRGEIDACRKKYHEKYEVSYQNFIDMNNPLVKKKLYLDGYRQVVNYSIFNQHLSFVKLFFFFILNVIKSYKVS